MGQRRFGNEATYCWFISHLLISTLLPIRLVKAKLQHRRVKVFQHSVVVQAVHSADQPLPSLLPRPSWKEGRKGPSVLNNASCHKHMDAAYHVKNVTFVFSSET